MSKSISKELIDMMSNNEQVKVTIEGKNNLIQFKAYLTEFVPSSTLRIERLYMAVSSKPKRRKK